MQFLRIIHTLYSTIKDYLTLMAFARIYFSKYSTPEVPRGRNPLLNLTEVLVVKKLECYEFVLLSTILLQSCFCITREDIKSTTRLYFSVCWKEQFVWHSCTFIYIFCQKNHVHSTMKTVEEENRALNSCVPQIVTHVIVRLLWLFVL